MRTVALLLILALAGCRKDEPQAPTAEQSAQLNEAEDLLNGMDRNAEGPADRSTGPSNSSD